MNRVCLTKDEIDATIKHHLNGAEREDLSAEQQKWLEESINAAVKELLEIGGGKDE